MMKTIDASLIEPMRARCRRILDVRSPAEFAEDHIPGAFNLPVLDNAQRAEIGTLYRKDPFRARKLGALYALHAIESYVASDEVQLASDGEAYLIYCARGGQRSGAISTVLAAIGFPVFRLAEGYKTYRAYVRELLERTISGPIFVLHGKTGSQKTKILQEMATVCNVIDLEGLARHRGSLLGDLPGQPQPHQRAFESGLAEAIRGLDTGKPTLFEGESRKIGALQIPSKIWQQMVSARHLWLELPSACRRDFILEDYHELKDSLYLEERLEKIARYQPKLLVQELRAHLAERHWSAFVDLLLEFHYDPLYQRNQEKYVYEQILAESPEEARAKIRSRLETAVRDGA